MRGAKEMDARQKGRWKRNRSDGSKNKKKKKNCLLVDEREVGRKNKRSAAIDRSKCVVDFSKSVVAVLLNAELPSKVFLARRSPRPKSRPLIG